MPRHTSLRDEPMNTRVLQVDAETPDPAAIAEAAAVLRAGRLVAFPTETVYGLGASALDPQAVERIFAAKGRPASDPLIVHIADPAQLHAVARDVPPTALALAALFWPGPLTLVLRRAPAVPAAVAAGRDTVAVRIPRHPVALALLQAAGLPVAAPSANLFARPSPTTAAHVLHDLGGRVDLVLDGGPTPIGLESTVLDLTGPAPVVLRPGGVTIEELRMALPEVAVAPRYLAADDGGEAPPSPGQLLRHYAPRARLTLVRGPGRLALARMRSLARELLDAGRSVGVLAADEEREAFAGLAVRVVGLGPRERPDRIGARLFAALRELDAEGVDAILARAPDQVGLGLAIWDRLYRAAEGRVVDADEPGSGS